VCLTIYIPICFLLTTAAAPMSTPKNSDGNEIEEQPLLKTRRSNSRRWIPPVLHKTVWKSDDDAVLVATLLKEQDEGRQSDSRLKLTSYVAHYEALEMSEESGNVAKTYIKRMVRDYLTPYQLSSVKRHWICKVNHR
jgi:hypothetical protein